MEEMTGSGRVEKIFSTYGFIIDSSSSQRYFFHFGKCITKPEMLQAGDPVDYILGQDTKSGRVHAQKVRLSRPTVAQSITLPMVPQPVFNPSLYNHLFPPLITADRTLSEPVSVQGVVVEAPDEYGENNRGTVAFKFAGQTFVAQFAWSALKFPQERSLVKFATQVDMTVSFQPESNVWSARHLLPIVPEVQGLISIVNNQSAIIDLAHVRRRIVFPLRFYTGKDPTFIAVGASVQFILVSSPKGEIASRLRVLEPGTVNIHRKSPNVSCGQVLLVPGEHNDDFGYVEITNDRGLKEPLAFFRDQMPTNCCLSVGDFVEFRVRLDIRDNSRCAVELHPVPLSPSPTDGSDHSTSGVSSATPPPLYWGHTNGAAKDEQGQVVRKYGFVAANTVNGGALIETEDHSQLLEAIHEGMVFRFTEVSFDLKQVGDSVKAANISILATGTLSSEFVLSSDLLSGVVIKEPNMEDAIYEGLIECPSNDLATLRSNPAIHGRRFPFTLLSLCSPIDYPKMVRNARVKFHIQAEPGDSRRAVLVRLDQDPEPI